MVARLKLCAVVAKMCPIGLDTGSILPRWLVVKSSQIRRIYAACLCDHLWANGFGAHICDKSPDGFTFQACGNLGGTVKMAYGCVNRYLINCFGCTALCNAKE